MDRTLSQAVSIPPSRWQVFTGAPHRMFFFTGIAQGVAAMTWWLADLLGRSSGWYAPIPWALPAPFAHAFLMVYGFFPFFMFGFLMTAVPSWLKVGVPRGWYQLAWLLMTVGLLLLYCGLVLSAAVATAGIATLLTGWAVGIAALVRLVKLTAESDVRQPLVLACVLTLGWIGAACLPVWIESGSALAADIFRRAGIWFFALPIFVSISNRMIPYFSSRVLESYRIVRPRWSQPLLLAGCAIHGGLEIAAMPQWTWTVDLPMLVAAVYLGLAWGLARSLKVRLLAVLHLSWAGLTVALLLFSIQSLVLLATGNSTLGHAPLHAMTVGYFSAMVIGMVSRVSLGHSGRTLTADRLTWYCFLGMLATAVLRVAAELPGIAGSAGPRLMPLAAIAWLACFIPWAWRYLPMYLSPRVDHNPG